MRSSRSAISRFTQLFTLPSRGKSPDFLLIVAVVFLAVFGVIMVYNTSVSIAIHSFGTPYQFIRDQVVWLALGITVLIICSRVDYRIWYPLSVPLLVVNLGMLILVFFPVVGVRVLGASRWLNLGLFTIQPSELAKLSVVLYLSAWFSGREKNRFRSFLIFLGLMVGLVVIQPDLGTSIILLIVSVSIYIVSGGELKKVLQLAPLLVIGVLILAVAAPYRFARLTTFLNPESDPLGASYQIRQAIIGIGSGGVFGVGLGKSRQKYQYLPEANTDAIFAVIAEELGFLATIVLLLVILFIIWRGFQVARKAPDPFGRLVAVGITSWFGFQAAINIGAIVSLLPLTGVPLPLVSYGGSSLVILLAAFGILINISRHRV